MQPDWQNMYIVHMYMWALVSVITNWYRGAFADPQRDKKQTSIQKKTKDKKCADLSQCMLGNWKNRFENVWNDVFSQSKLK